MPKILVVDDALTERVRVKGLVSGWQDCTVIEADNGATALQQIEDQTPDIVLSDLHMPEMDGLELLAAVREDYPNIPVVLITAQGSEDIAAEALRRGAASYVPKLRLADDLVQTLDQVYHTAQVTRSQFRLMHYIQKTNTEFVLPNDLTLIKACVDQVLDTLRCLPLGEESERLRVGIALEAALENACLHGNLNVRSEAGDDTSRYIQVARSRAWEEPYLDRKIRLKIDINRDRAVFVVSDEGEGFSVESALSSQNPGRGITLMQTIMDEVTYNEAGNVVTMIRRAAVFDDDGADEDDDAGEDHDD